MLPVLFGGRGALERFLLDYRKRVFDGSFQYGDGYNVSEKGVQTYHMSKTVTCWLLMVVTGEAMSSVLLLVMVMPLRDGDAAGTGDHGRIAVVV